MNVQAGTRTMVSGTRAPQAALHAEGLTKHYGPVVALDGLDLTIKAGEVVGYLGPMARASPTSDCDSSCLWPRFSCAAISASGQNWPTSRGGN